MMLPILISVSVAPVSYFFCASAPLPDAASSASAVAEATTILFVMTGMIVSLFSIHMDGVCHGLLDRKLFEPRRFEYHFTGCLLRKSASAQGRKDCCS